MSVNTLKLFFVLHFLLPWFLLLLLVIHLLFLHERGSTTVLLVHGDYSKIVFTPFYIFKDFLNVFVWFLFLFVVLYFPFLLRDPEVYREANFLMSPVHIVPE